MGGQPAVLKSKLSHGNWAKSVGSGAAAGGAPREETFTGITPVRRERAPSKGHFAGRVHLACALPRVLLPPRRSLAHRVEITTHSPQAPLPSSPLLSHCSRSAEPTSKTSISRTRVGKDLRTARAAAGPKPDCPTLWEPVGPAPCWRPAPGLWPRPRDCRLAPPLAPLPQPRPTSSCPSLARSGRQRSCAPLPTFLGCAARAPALGGFCSGARAPPLFPAPP